MRKYKLAFFDIDGTPIGLDAHCPTPKALETLRRLQAGGTKICIATGRAPVTLPHFDGVDFDAFLTFNGSLCYTREGDEIFSNPIPEKDLHLLLKNASAMGKPLCFATKERLAANGSDNDLVAYFSFANLVVPPAEDLEPLCAGQVYQIMMSSRAEDYPAVLKDVTGAKITAWWDRAVDIIPAAGGKGVGIERILAYYGFTPEDAIAFGDGNNDLEMIRTVGTGVAMGNASAALKAAAAAVCGTVEEDGLFHYCADNGLI